MKITILQGPFFPVPPLRGGAVEKMWFSLGLEFAARGHTVTQVSRLCDGLPVAETIGGVQHLRVAGFDTPKNLVTAMTLDLIYSLRAARRAPTCDVTVTNSFWAPVVLGRRHGAIYVDVQRMPKGHMRLYRGAARLRANSSAVSAAILREAPKLANRVAIIPNSLSFVPEWPVQWAAKTKTVLFAGRIHPEKGIELLLEAWELRRKRGWLPGWELHLVGPVKRSQGGGGEAWADELRRKYSAPDVKWCEPVFDIAGLSRIYEKATVFAYPSLATKGETFGVAVLEAMAWGAIPVVSGLACFRDFVVDGQNGFFFDHTGAEPAAALCDALGRAAENGARPCAERAVGVRETHSCSTIAELFLDDFARLTSKSTMGSRNQIEGENSSLVLREGSRANPAGVPGSAGTPAAAIPKKRSLVRRQPPGAQSPWTLGTRLLVIVWILAWAFLCRWTPKPANGWRLLVLRLFGAKIEGHPFVHQRAVIDFPWNVELHDRSCIGDAAHLYSQDRIVLHRGALVAQESYLCCGTHDLTDDEWPLMTAPISIGERAFVGARAFVLPGVTIGARAVVGACAVVTRDVAAGETVAGNPAKVILKA